MADRAIEYFLFHARRLWITGLYDLRAIYLFARGKSHIYLIAFCVILRFEIRLLIHNERLFSSRA
jgi:hypothetical protein